MNDGSENCVHAASIVAQNKKKNAFEAWQQGLVQKVSNILQQQAFQAAPATCPPHVWRGGPEQHKVIVLKVMSNTLRKTITDCSVAT